MQGALKAVKNRLILGPQGLCRADTPLCFDAEQGFILEQNRMLAKQTR
jgi:hypothetical protein